MPPHIFLGGMFWQDRLQQHIGSGEPPRLRDEKTGNAVGTILTAFLLPFILIIVCLCGMMDAAADHNRAAVEWCFGDGAIPATMPEEFADILHRCVRALLCWTARWENSMRSWKKVLSRFAPTE